MVSPNLVSAINASSTQQAFLFLLTFTTQTGVIRVVNNNVDITSRGDLYTAYPFQIVLDADTGDKQPEISLTIDNVDQYLVEMIRGFLDPPSVKLELVLSGTPDTVEKTVDYLRLGNASYDSLSIQGKLIPINILQRKFPAENYTATRFPDLFYA
jgi:hypothetical protein